MQIDKTFLKLIRTKIEEALAELGTTHNIRITAGGATYDRGGKFATMKLEITTIDETGKAASKDAEAFKVYAVMFGLKPDDLGKKFLYHDRVCTITGLAPKSGKYPVLAERDDGKVYKFRVDDVTHGMGRLQARGQKE